MYSNAEDRQEHLGNNLAPVICPHGTLVCRMPFCDEFIDLIEIVDDGAVKYGAYVQNESGYFPFQSNEEVEFSPFEDEDQLLQFRVEASNELIETINSAFVSFTVGKTLSDMLGRYASQND